MKNLSLISFVGIDAMTEFDNLLQFKDSNIIYEFGILYSNSKNNNYIRYPGFKVCENYLKWAMSNKINSSIHLCGESITNYLNNDDKIIELCSYANRIQLNINIYKYNDYEKLSSNILDIANKYNHNIILQHNDAKEEFNKIFFNKIKNTSLSLLHDSSGGYGKLINKVLPPEEKYFTGYAGGINSTNILYIISLINNCNINNLKYYIDMESCVMVNNIFSIDECIKIKSLIDNGHLI